jgi:hypothetical protein
MSNIEKKLPVAVTVSNVLSLIRAHTENDNQEFLEKALAIATELELNDEHELALYIYAQFRLVPTFDTRAT